ncbi:MAG: thioredoxin family protein [Leptospiraceae bacterium]|nr:thioredoxin family protein [Leptospiraceae bacterium]
MIRWMSRVSIATLLILAALHCEQERNSVSQAIPGEPAPAFSLVDSTGNTHNLSDYEGSFVVLEWINYDCPYVRKHYESGNMQALQKEYSEKGVIWLAINSSAPGKQGHFSSEEIASRSESHGANFKAYLLDEGGETGLAYGAKTTPHMYVINPQGVLIYAGAIDDKPTSNLKDIEGATNYVRQALEAAMNGKPVAKSRTRAYGCSVKYGET